MADHGRWRKGALVLAVALSGCTQFPQLDAAAPARDGSADYPGIVPLDAALLAGTAAPVPGADAQGAAALAARADDLQRRAALLRMRDL